MIFAQTISGILPGWLGRSHSAPLARPMNAAVTQESSDEQLFQRVCASNNGDPGSFDILVTRYRGRMVALVRRMLASSQSGIDPEDIAQEAFIDAYRRRHTFKRGAQLRPWLYGIAVNRCLDHIRAHGRDTTTRLEPEQIESANQTSNHENNDPVEIVLTRFETDALERGVAALPPKLRAVLVLRYLDDMQYEEIGAALNIPVGTVKTNLFRARAELRTRMTNAAST